MAKLKTLFLAMVCGLLAASAQAQSTNSFKLTIAPATGTVMITETTNVLTVAIANLFATNTVVEEGETNSVTNTVISPIFSNVVVTATYAGKTSTLVDTGVKPDAKSKDSIYSGYLIAPTTKVALNLPVTFTIKGDDVTATNESGVALPIPVSTKRVFTFKIYPRPINDKFTNAFKIESQGGTFTTYEPFLAGNKDLMTNNYASLETGEPVHGGTSDDASVWWMWSSPARTNVLFDLAGSSFNPILAVYTGNAANSLTLVTNALSATKKAFVNFTAEAGRTYRIAIASPDTNIASQGSIRLRVAPGANPDAEGPTTRITSPADGSLFTSSSVTFAGTAAEPAGPQSGLSKVYLKVNGGAAQLAGSNAVWSKTLTLPAGTNTIDAYSVDFVGNTGPSATIKVIFMNPTNDFFASSIRLSQYPATLKAINGRATKEVGEPNHGGNEGGHSIWYRFQAPTDGILSLTTSNSSFDTLLSVYTGDSATNLTLVGSNDDAFQGSGWSALECRVVSNEVYRIAIDGYGGASGDIQLTYNFVEKAPASFYSLKLTVWEGGQVSPGPGYYPTNSEVTLLATAETNYVFTGWEGDLHSTNNPVKVSMTSDKSIVARFRYLNYIEDFETGGFNPKRSWSFGGQKPWVVQSDIVRDQYSAQSGPIADGQQSRMRLVVKSIAGQASFDFKLSSEEPYDVLEFSLNGVKLKQWAGDLDWRTFYFDVPAGTNTLEWTYAKDSSFSDGFDAAFVDNINLPQGPTAATVTAARLPDNTMQVRVQGRLNRTYQIETSSNMVDWTHLTTQTTVDGEIVIVDPSAAAYPQRYYRAVTH